MRVLVTGGRTFRDRDWLWAGLDLLHSRRPITEIIEGGATGADVRAGEWAYRREIRCTVVPAQWELYSAGLKHGQKNPAGAIRNVEMAKMRPDLVLVCPGGTGTAHMVETAKAHKLGIIFLERLPIMKGAAGIPAAPSQSTVVVG
jgi:hypothetical protein